VRLLVGTGFKMNLTSSEARRYFDAFVPLVASLTACDLFVLPPFTSIWVARERLSGSNVAWGAQDVHPEDGGAHTGDISAAMLSDLGCTYVEVGHSERRRDHGETDASVAAKVAQILRHQMTPIVCVGEPSRGLVAALDFVLSQVRTVCELVRGPERGRVIFAYEPVWAIGIGAMPADPSHVGAMHSGIHELLLSKAGGGHDSRVIYGGSVDVSSARPLLDEHGVDGLFVGRAALDPHQLAAIAAVADRVAASSPG